jgi:hypothetical protein
MRLSKGNQVIAVQLLSQKAIAVQFLTHKKRSTLVFIGIPAMATTKKKNS